MTSMFYATWEAMGNGILVCVLVHVAAPHIDHVQAQK